MLVLTLTLPSQGRRALLRGFWWTAAVLAAAPWLIAGWWFQADALVGGGLAVAGLMALAALLREDLVWRVYRAWNRRLVRPFAAAATRVVVAACFFVVFVAAGRGGSRLASAATGEGRTLWAPRCSLPPDAYRALFAAAQRTDASGVWIPDYVRWATETGNIWAISLLPFFALLRVLARESEQTPHQANIYTLF